METQVHDDDTFGCFTCLDLLFLPQNCLIFNWFHA